MMPSIAISCSSTTSEEDMYRDGSIDGNLLSEGFARGSSMSENSKSCCGVKVIAHEDDECCPICYDNYSLEQYHWRGKVKIIGCGHEVCRGCLKDHCSYAISVRNFPISCPQCLSPDFSTQNTGVLPTDVIRETLLMQDVTNLDWVKFQRLERIFGDSSLISCTRCDELISPKAPQHSYKDDEDPNRIHCPSCQHVFCRIHGDGHLRKTCIEANRCPKETDPSELAILEFCKLCSHCQVPIYKEEGCNHVVCSVCKRDMCFRCGTHEYLESKGRTIRACANCNGSYFDHRKLRRHRLIALAKLPIMLPIYLGYMTMSLSMVIATCGCFCCLGCGVRCTEPMETKKQGKAKKIVFMPLMALREVLGWLLLPFIECFRDFRFPCCFCHDARGLCKGRPTDDENSDDDADDDEDVDKTYPTERDIENQK